MLRYDHDVMATIKETVLAACPYVRAREYLHEALSQAAKSQTEQPLLLTAPLPVGQIEIEKGVRVHYLTATDPMHFDEPWYIGWEPEPGGVYPSFSGVLTVRADEDYGSAILEITGSYAAPLGAAGALFDKAVGRNIAQKTMQALLSKISARMCERYRREEAAKKALS